MQPSKVAPSELKEGRLKAGAAINGIKENHTLKIDVMVLVDLPALICDSVVEIDEGYVRKDKDGELKRQTYEYGELLSSSLEKKRLSVGTEFFRGMEETDCIIIILH